MRCVCDTRDWILHGLNWGLTEALSLNIGVGVSPSIHHHYTIIIYLFSKQSPSIMVCRADPRVSATWTHPF